LPSEIILDYRATGGWLIRRILEARGVHVRCSETTTSAATERLFRRIERDVLTLIPGCTGRAHVEPELPEKESMLSSEEMEARLLAWVAAHNRAITRTTH
jgi:hypothetical protein